MIAASQISKACGCGHGQVLLNHAGGGAGRLDSVEIGMGNHLNSVFRVDPTRTKTIRDGFARECTKRFRELRTAINISIVDNDCFGLKEAQPVRERPRFQALAKPSPALPKQFDFPRTFDKIQKFMDWLNEQEERGILEIIRRPGALRGIEEAWSDVWVYSAYQKGILQARQELRRINPDIPPLAASGAIGNQLINAVMNQSMHADRLGALFTRTFNELKGIDQAADQQISRLLSQALMEGKGPRAIARDLADVLEANGAGTATGMRSIQRARVMARTEIIRAHHTANINEFRQWGMEEVTIKAEWSTAGFNVCPICEELQGKVYTLDQIEGMIPRHPNCRCVAIPVEV